MSSLEKCLFRFLAHFLIGSFIFLELRCRCCLYIFEINSLSVASFVIIFFHSEGYLFTLLRVSFIVQKLLSLIRSPLFICFYFHYSGRWVIKDPAVIYVRVYFFILFPCVVYCPCPVTKLCLTLCNPMEGSTPGSSVLHCLPEFAQIHVRFLTSEPPGKLLYHTLIYFCSPSYHLVYLLGLFLQPWISPIDSFSWTPSS